MMERIKVVGGSHDAQYVNIDGGLEWGHLVVLRLSLPQAVTTFPAELSAAATIHEEIYQVRVICVPHPHDRTRHWEFRFLAPAQWDDQRAISNLIADY